MSNLLAILTVRSCEGHESPRDPQERRHVRAFQVVDHQAAERAADAKRGQLFTKSAEKSRSRRARACPTLTQTLVSRLAVDRAKTANMPKDNIERAIQRAAGSGRATSTKRSFTKATDRGRSADDPGPRQTTRIELSGRSGQS